MQLARKQIEDEDVSKRNFLSLNLEDRECQISDAESLYERCKSAMSPNSKTYLFLDEIQRIPDWHDVINSLCVGFDCDIYLTGSNAFLLSGELATYLSGRYVEISLLPLSFNEYVNFCGLKVNSSGTLLIQDGNFEPIMADELLERYLTYGGLPALASLKTTQQQHNLYVNSLVDTIIVRDIMSKERNASERRITSEDNLRSICTFLADNIGNKVSNSNIARVVGISDKTAGSYVKALNDAYIFYSANRYDIHGKAILNTLPKQYIVDLGIRSNLLGYRSTDKGSCLENAVYLQLLNNEWSVHVGRYYNKEVDFVCVKNGEVRYVQVTHDMNDIATQERELKPLQNIPDNYEKMIIVRNAVYESDIDGVRIVPAYKFLLGLA